MSGVAGGNFEVLHYGPHSVGNNLFLREPRGPPPPRDLGRNGLRGLWLDPRDRTGARGPTGHPTPLRPLLGGNRHVIAAQKEYLSFVKKTVTRPEKQAELGGSPAGLACNKSPNRGFPRSWKEGSEEEAAKTEATQAKDTIQSTSSWDQEDGGGGRGGNDRRGESKTPRAL